MRRKPHEQDPAGQQGLRRDSTSEEIEVEEDEAARIEEIYPNNYARWLMHQEAARRPIGVKKLG